MAEIFGRNPVLELLKSDKSINKILIASGSHKGSIQEIIKLAKEKRIPFQQVDKSKLDKMFPGQNHQGVVALVAVADYVDWQDILENARRKKEEPLIIMLDEIEDPHNLGAILRTVDAVGAHGVIIPKRRAVPLTEGVAKASAGAVEYVPVARVANLAQTIDQLKKEGCWIVGTSLEGNNFYEQDLKGPLVVIIGSEGRGLSKLTKEKCDFLVTIPMFGKINSLNASVAAGVVLYEILKQRSIGRAQ
ncbi:MAG: rRNA (guanosine2251-2-O)-methyltransferase [Clostridia bacterium]|jgi:23S rRNA (guanosine2251-2'-O)-methyltransferase|nr:rRNA (guanosine2251-2-O)-methyltransferase [Clostridia bacterium]MDN5323986.1 rRNA (guanosine2251-2-O)-methyltransferase [Clostridia bacterium]